MPVSNASLRNRKNLLQEFLDVRAATISLFANLTQEQLKFIGTASSFPMSTAAAGFIVCGHLEHHSKIISEKYLQ